ncbi:polysaccharide deacetylase family protein [Actinocorallia populi]|uniref:polysaccharide deacetylase family protein n=1 Tax=Actinocorallia populi TaxID=2079200 RepID=UPI001E6565C4|nr:polysaccharide deacetylase family protein [Actinocorallia populi]
MRMRAVGAAFLGIAAGLWPCPPAAAAADRPQTRVDCAQAKCVALTFDDGPVPGTARLLGLLRRSGARATFFVVGVRARAHPGLVARARAEGHEIGDHTEHHPRLTALPSARVHRELATTRRTITRLTGTRPTLFRPPYGATDRRVAAQARRLGLAQVLWDVDTLDWRHRDPSAIARRAVNGLRPGAIILMHDSRPTTVSAVPRILRAAKAKGYTFVTVTELLGPTVPGRTYVHARR